MFHIRESCEISTSLIAQCFFPISTNHTECLYMKGCAKCVYAAVQVVCVLLLMTFDSVMSASHK